MKAFCLKRKNLVGFQEVAEPSLSGYPYGAIVRPILVSPCTSDVHTIYGTGAAKAPNLVLGHEAIGIVISVSELVKDFHVGDRVAIPAITPDWREPEIQNGNYGHAGAHFSGHKLGRTLPGVFAESLLIPDADTTLAHIPDCISNNQALMCVDVVTTGLTGAEGADIHFGDTVCVIGVGAIGQMAIAGAKLSGAGRIIAIGTRRKGVELAMQDGANEVISYKKEDIAEGILTRTSQRGCDSVIIAGGNDDVFNKAFEMVCYGTGTVSNVNYYAGDGSLAFSKFHGGRGMAGKTLKTLLAKGGRSRLERIFDLIRFGRLDPAPLVTHELQGFDMLPQAIELMRNKPDDLMKIAVHV